jgi:hypothetical protein
MSSHFPLSRTTRLAFYCALVCCIALPVQAQVYKWKDAQGRTVISDTPPPGAARETQAVPAAKPDPAATDSQKSWAEKDMELKKRLQEQKDAAAKAEKEKAEAAQRAENCKRAKQQQALLESGERIAHRNLNGEREYITDQQRQDEIERARQAVQEWCK